MKTKEYAGEPLLPEDLADEIERLAYRSRPHQQKPPWLRDVMVGRPGCGLDRVQHQLSRHRRMQVQVDGSPSLQHFTELAQRLDYFGNGVAHTLAPLRVNVTPVV